MKRLVKIIITAALLSAFFSCSDIEENVENLVEIRQIMADGSNDYRIIFEDQIKKEKYERAKYIVDDFR